mmetsp:Transcript_19755/g.46603  ORF Transcript_19755/g.46603 Transcript_19755/m.46603 type:complete len:206 (-) Transcript_19755:2406-3023(-)
MSTCDQSVSRQLSIVWPLWLEKAHSARTAARSCLQLWTVASACSMASDSSKTTASSAMAARLPSSSFKEAAILSSCACTAEGARPDEKTGSARKPTRYSAAAACKSAISPRMRTPSLSCCGLIALRNTGAKRFTSLHSLSMRDNSFACSPMSCSRYTMASRSWSISSSVLSAFNRIRCRRCITASSAAKSSAPIVCASPTVMSAR